VASESPSTWITRPHSASLDEERLMSTALPSSFPADCTAADMQDRLGGIPLERIRMVPPPGTATEEDVLAVHDRTNRLCELVDGTLVEKAMRKLEEYFRSGARLVWYIDPATRTARVYTAPDRVTALEEHGLLTGGDVLPGFELRLGDLFARAERGV
jgi:hypothetical protein